MKLVQTQHPWRKLRQWPPVWVSFTAASIPSCMLLWVWSSAVSSWASSGLWAAKWQVQKSSLLSATGEAPCGPSLLKLPTHLLSEKDKNNKSDWPKQTWRQIHEHQRIQLVFVYFLCYITWNQHWLFATVLSAPVVECDRTEITHTCICWQCMRFPFSVFWAVL